MDISVVIVTHRPYEEIHDTIRTTIIQECCDFEIILVLNSPAVFLSDNEKIIIKKLDGNYGAVARNEGIAIAKGKYIVCIDDDIEFENAFQLNYILKYMENNPDVFAASFKVLTPSGGLDHYSWCHPRDRFEYCDKEFETYHISEGAVVFRRKTFDILGEAYFMPLFIGHEGGDLALRMINNGLKIMYFPGVKVIHKKSDIGRPHGRAYYYLTRNGIWVSWKNLPWHYAIYYTLRTLALMFFFSFRSSGLLAYFKGVKDGIFGLPMIFKVRNPINGNAITKLKEISNFKPSFASRLYFHIKEKVQ
ncbi:MAG: glycosyltransferase [bacterium]|jgi:GT2 family glycosyltransferase